MRNLWLFGRVSSEREVVLVKRLWGGVSAWVRAIGLWMLFCLAASPASAGAPVARATFTEFFDGKVARRIERETRTLIGETRWNGTVSGRVIVPLDGIDVSTFDRSTEFSLSFGYDALLGESVNVRLGGDRSYRKGKRSARFHFRHQGEERIGVESMVLGLRWTATELTAYITARATRTLYPVLAPISLDQIENRPGNRVVGYGGLVVSIAGRESRMDLVGEGTGALTTEVFHGEDLTVGKLLMEVESYTPQFRVDPPVLQMYGSRIGSPQTLTVTLTNLGDEPVSGNVEELAAPFAVTAGEGAFTLAPGESRAIDVTFSAIDKQFYYSRLRISTTSVSRPVVYVPLVGRVGVAPPPHSRPIRN